MQDHNGQEAAQHNSSARVLCAIHGAGGGGWQWQRWRWLLQARGWQVQAPDLQPADGGLAATRFEDYLDQIVSAAQECGASVLAGASLGGQLALQAAPRLPGLRALVLVNPLPPAPWHHGLPARDWPAVKRWAHRHHRAGTLAAMAGCDAGAVGYAAARWRDESGAVLRAAGGGMAPPVLLPGLRVLVIAGAEDADVPAAGSRAFAAGIGAEYVELAGAGHLEPLLGGAAEAAVGDVVKFVEGTDQHRAFGRLAGHRQVAFG